ncbi:MAG: hypothetical protein ACETWG_01870, partial [Candidatus Neomarinimicrobiota bacterium]
NHRSRALFPPSGRKAAGAGKCSPAGIISNPSPAKNPLPILGLKHIDGDVNYGILLDYRWSPG